MEHNEWHKTQQGKEYFASILRHGKRRAFGLLESPLLSTHLTPPQVIKYKLCLVGKASVGKTSTVAKLTGQPVPNTHSETPGIITSIAFWPARLRDSGKVVMFRLQFWDAGHSVQRKFDHILPACKEKSQAVLHLFSFTDRSSFEDLQNQISKPPPPGENALRVVIGTKYDQYSRSEITSRELHDFQQQWQVPVLKLKNTVKPTDTNTLLAGDSSSEIDDVAPAMNTLVEYLWIHEQVQMGNAVASPAQRQEPSLGRAFRESAIREEVVYDDEDDDDEEATYV